MAWDETWQCAAQGRSWGLNFHCHLHGWPWRRRKKLGLGDSRCLSGSSMIKFGKRHVLWRDRAGEVFPMEKGNTDAVSPAWAAGWLGPRRGLTSATRHLLFQESLFRAVWESLLSVGMWRSVLPHPVYLSGKLNLLKGHGFGPIEHRRKG